LSQRRRLGKERSIGGQRYAQARANQVIFEFGGLGRASEQSGNISKDSDRIDRGTECFGEFGTC
jgi:hypothetical protein